jgi:putative hydrolase of the HAD superfamily
VISTLLVDVDGVLQFDRPGFASAIERDYKWRRGGFMAYKRKLLHDPAAAKALRGQGDLLDVIAETLPDYAVDLPAEVFFDRLINENNAMNDELLSLLAQVKVEAIYIATNQEPHRAALIKELYGGEPWISGFLISSDLGYAKPDPAFFTAALDRIGRAASECLLIDDNPRYLTGAAAVGIKGILYRTNLDLATRLAEMGLLGEPVRRS